MLHCKVARIMDTARDVCKDLERGQDVGLGETVQLEHISVRNIKEVITLGSSHVLTHSQKKKEQATEVLQVQEVPPTPYKGPIKFGYNVDCKTAQTKLQVINKSATVGLTERWRSGILLKKRGTLALLRRSATAHVM